EPQPQTYPPPPPPPKMADKADQGRQSPEPEAQAGKQQGDAQGKPNDQGVKSEQGAKEQLSGLESNPTSIMDKKAEEKTSKTVKNQDAGGAP
ncbi:hypothetical protein LTR28_005228, partial [Elasticomyces elasticus]